ncbi:MAG: TIGR04086 family membrane protein [Ruminococcaceae bacterium]|nr:TIGR04086 family membrane protein [Oscillospiraceae bacterium]
MMRHTAVPETAPGFFLSVLKPLFISLAVTFLALCLLAICIAYGPVSEQAADTCIRIATVVCVFLSGFLSARQKSNRGFLWGGMAGLMYAVTAYIIAALVFGSMTPGTGFLRLLLLGLLAGSIGGTVGVNTRRKKR